MEDDSQRIYYGGNAKEYNEKSKKNSCIKDLTSEDIANEIGKCVISGKQDKSEGGLTPDERFKICQDIQRQLASQKSVNYDTKSVKYLNRQNDKYNNKKSTSKSGTSKNKKKRNRKMTLKGKAVIAAFLLGMGYVTAKPHIDGAVGKIDKSEEVTMEHINEYSNTQGQEGFSDVITEKSPKLDDKIEYIIDFCEYNNPSAEQHLVDLANSDKVNTFAFRMR